MQMDGFANKSEPIVAADASVTHDVREGIQVLGVHHE
jgi:hypothetical protein